MIKRKYLVFSNDVAPARDGLYQREFCKNSLNMSQHWLWAFYEDGKWRCTGESVNAAKAMRFHSAYQVGDSATRSTLRWRGLAEKPE